MCNRVGREGEMEFAGESLLADANGSLIIKADDMERLIIVDTDLTAPAKVRAGKPYTNLRRPEVYS